MKRAVSIPLRCRCGQVQGEIGTAHTYVRATCYCKDCRAFAQRLGAPGLLDAAGGVDIVAMAPSEVRITSGQAQVACMSLSDRGIHRWYASCCRTPLGNMGRNPAIHYVGMSTACMGDDGGAVDAAFGPAGRCVINTGSATAPVRKMPVAFVTGGLRILLGILRGKLRGLRGSPFYDVSKGRAQCEVVRPINP